MKRERDKNRVDRDTTSVVPSMGVRAGAGRENHDTPYGVTFVLPFYDDCELCFAAFQKGELVHGCRCVLHQADD